jgi:hypothetical protein
MPELRSHDVTSDGPPSTRTVRRRARRHGIPLAVASAALALIAACGGTGTPNGPSGDDPAAPSITTLGTGFDVVPAGTSFTAAFAVTPPSDDADVSCALRLDGEPLLDVPAPCTEGTIVLGPLAAGDTVEVSLVATTAAGAVASGSWSATAAAWAPFQRVGGAGDVLAVAGGGERLAILRDADADALHVLVRPVEVREAGVWSPPALTPVASLPRGRGAAIAWHGDTLAWLGEAASGSATVDRFAAAGSAWELTGSIALDWPVPFVAPRLSVSDALTLIGDGASGATGRWRASHAGAGISADESFGFGIGFPPATPGDLAGSAVAALGDVMLVGAPEAERYEGDLAYLPPNGRVLVAAPSAGSWETLAGGFASGPGSRIGAHLAVATAPTPVVFHAGAYMLSWSRVAFVAGEDDEPGGNELMLLGEMDLDSGAETPRAVAWLSVGLPPRPVRAADAVLAVALVAIGYEGGEVEVLGAPLTADAVPTPLGIVDGSGATGAGAWVGGALALPFGDEVVLYDLSVPPGGGPGGD